jgi:drug/metabolite transporter (DMT)-like permease
MEVWLYSCRQANDFFFGEMLTSWKIAGVLLIVAGVAMISVHSGR